MKVKVRHILRKVEQLNKVDILSLRHVVVCVMVRLQQMKAGIVKFYFAGPLGSGCMFTFAKGVLLMR